MTEGGLRSTLGYPKFAGARPSVLLFETGYHVENDARAAAQDLGFRVASLRVPAKGTASSAFARTLLEALCMHRPDFVLTLNHFGFDEEGALARLLDEYEIPVASWFVDHPLLILPEPRRLAVPTCQVFTLERTSLPALRAAGFESPQHLPTASSARVFHPSRIDRALAAELGAPLTLIASSWWQKARVESSPQQRAAAAALGWPMPLPRDFAGAELAATLCGPSVDARERMWAARVAVAESSLRSRLAFARAFATEGLVVRGDEGWGQVEGVDLRAPVPAGRPLAAAFAGSDVNLNVTSDQLATAVTQRVWDVPACGAFLLTDAQEDALELFVPGREIAVFRSTEEAVSLARHYAAHPRERLALVQQARRVIELGHRYTHRLATIAQVMSERVMSRKTCFENVGWSCASRASPSRS